MRRRWRLRRGSARRRLGASTPQPAAPAADSRAAAAQGIQPAVSWCRARGSTACTASPSTRTTSCSPARVIGQTIYRVQVDSGEVDRFVEPPIGMADDIAFAEDGTHGVDRLPDGQGLYPPRQQDDRGRHRHARSQLAGLQPRTAGCSSPRSSSATRCTRSTSRTSTSPTSSRSRSKRAAPGRREAGRPERLRDQPATTASSTARCGSRARRSRSTSRTARSR